MQATNSTQTAPGTQSRPLLCRTTEHICYKHHPTESKYMGLGQRSLTFSKRIHVFICKQPCLSAYPVNITCNSLIHTYIYTHTYKNHQTVRPCLLCTEGSAGCNKFNPKGNLKEMSDSSYYKHKENHHCFKFIHSILLLHLPSYKSCL